MKTHPSRLYQFFCIVRNSTLIKVTIDRNFPKGEKQCSNQPLYKHKPILDYEMAGDIHLIVLIPGAIVLVDQFTGQATMSPSRFVYQLSRLHLVAHFDLDSLPLAVAESP